MNEIDVDRAYAAFGKELAEQEQRQRALAERTAACPHEYKVLRSGIKRENPDDGAHFVDVFYCLRCLHQVVVRAITE